MPARVAIVTGASRGIGRAIAQQLSHDGYRLVLVARSGDALQALAASLATDAVACALDLRETDAAQQVVERAIASFGRLDALVNNAGATPRGDFLGFGDDDWQDGFALKFFGAVRLCRAAWPHLQATQGGIVNVAGIGGRTGNAGFTIGGSVNAALLNLTKALADRGVQDGVVSTRSIPARSPPSAPASASISWRSKQASPWSGPRTNSRGNCGWRVSARRKKWRTSSLSCFRRRPATCRARSSMSTAARRGRFERKTGNGDSENNRHRDVARHSRESGNQATLLLLPSSQTQRHWVPAFGE